MEQHEIGAQFLPERDLLSLIDTVDQMSSDLWDEVEAFLDDGIPRTTEGTTSLLRDRFSVGHQSVYSLDLTRMWDFMNTAPDEVFDKINAVTEAIEKVVDRMHVVCTLRDDIVEAVCFDYGHYDIITRYTIMEQLAIQNHNLGYQSDRLKKAAKDLRKDEAFCQHSLFDNDERDEINAGDAVSLEDNENFSSLYNFIQDIFPYYISSDADVAEYPEAITEYQKYVISSLDSFVEGKALSEFSFSFIHRAHNEMLGVSILTDGESSIQVSEFGHIYTPNVGGDSFTNWSWWIWNNGDESGTFGLSVSNVAEMIDAGAKLSIELPEKYFRNEDD